METDSAKNGGKSCPVCQGSMGGKDCRTVTYGGVCCLSCRAFFRRAHQNSKPPNYTCYSNGKCDLRATTSRRRCPRCRLDACLRSGMKPELVLNYDQRSYRFRHARAKKIAKLDTAINLIKPKEIEEIKRDSETPKFQINFKKIDIVSEAIKSAPLFVDLTAEDDTDKEVKIHQKEPRNEDIDDKVASQNDARAIGFEKGTGISTNDINDEVKLCKPDFKTVLIRTLEENLNYFNCQALTMLPRAKSIDIDDRQALLTQNKRLFLNFVFGQYLTSKNGETQKSWLRTTSEDADLDVLVFENLDELLVNRMGFLRNDKILQTLYINFSGTLSKQFDSVPSLKKDVAETLLFYPGNIDLSNRTVVDQHFLSLVQQFSRQLGQNVNYQDFYEMCQSLEAMSILFDHSGLTGDLLPSYSSGNGPKTGNLPLTYSAEEELWLVSMKDKMFSAMASVSIGAGVIMDLVSFVLKGAGISPSFGASAKHVFSERFLKVYLMHPEFRSLSNIDQAKIVLSSRQTLFTLVCARLDSLPMEEQGMFIVGPSVLESDAILGGITKLAGEAKLCIRTRDVFPSLGDDWDRKRTIIQNAIGKDKDGMVFFALMSTAFFEAMESIHGDENKDARWKALEKLKKKYDMSLTRRFGAEYDLRIRPVLKELSSMSALTTCPERHPYALNGRKHCCRFSVEKNDTNLDPSCDGNRVNIPTALECCYLGEFVPCPDQERGCKHATPAKEVCSAEPSIAEVNSVYGDNHATFGAGAVLLRDTKCDDRPDYWMTKNTIGFFVMDIGCPSLIQKIFIRNTRNSDWNTWGTANFTVETSEDNTNWKLNVQDTLQDVRGIDKCNLPVFEFPLNPVGYGRYIKFSAKSFYGNGAGLNWIGWQLIN